MTPIAIDTNAYSAMRRGAPAAIEVIRGAVKLLVSSTTVGELLAGFEGGSKRHENRKALADFLASERVTFSPATLATSECYAHVLQSLKRRGKPIPANDIWIAASALEHGAALFTFDAHFSEVEGLRTGVNLSDFLP